MFEKTKNEKYCEKYLKENGFEILEIKQYQSKTKYKVQKNNVEDMVELPYCVTDIKTFMCCINQFFEMKCDLIKRGMLKR